MIGFGISLMRISSLTILFLALMLSSCSFFSNDNEPDRPGAGLLEKEIYDRAIRALESNQSRTAIEYLQALEAQFPFGAYAEQAQLELIYAYYRSANYDAAMGTADRFIRLHPDHSNIDYAYYMRGLITYARESSFFGQFLPIDITKRDPGSAREAYGHFSELLVRFPDTPYGEDARKRLIFLRNLLARHEINVANYYFQRGAHLSATNRGRFVVENFQGSPAVADGLAVMAQGYTLLGYEELADSSIAVLRENFPDHPALDVEGNFKRRQLLAGKEKSFLNRVSFGLLDRPEPLGFDTRELYNPEYREGSSQPLVTTAVAPDEKIEAERPAPASLQ